MRIAILLVRLEFGGVELAMIEVARERAARGYQVMSYTRFDPANAQAVLTHAQSAPSGD